MAEPLLLLPPLPSGGKTAPGLRCHCWGQGTYPGTQRRAAQEVQPVSSPQCCPRSDQISTFISVVQNLLLFSVLEDPMFACGWRKEGLKAPFPLPMGGKHFGEVDLNCCAQAFPSPYWDGMFPPYHQVRASWSWCFFSSQRIHALTAMHLHRL